MKNLLKAMILGIAVTSAISFSPINAKAAEGVVPDNVKIAVSNFSPNEYSDVKSLGNGSVSIEIACAYEIDLEGNKHTGDMGGTTFYLDVDHYEIQVSTDKTFSDTSSTKNYTIAKTDGSSYPTLNFNPTDLSENGNVFYYRYSDVFKDQDGNLYQSAWASTDTNGDVLTQKSFTSVRICEENFGGITKLLQKYSDETGNKYDENGDGWLDDSDLDTITFLSNKKKSSSENTDIYCKVKSIKGTEYLYNLSIIDFYGYSGKTLTVKNPKVKRIWLYGLTQKSIKIKAPYVKDIYLEPRYSWLGGSKLSNINLSNCKSAIEINAQNSEGKYGKISLPTSQTLESLSLSQVAGKINLNKYKNLKEVYIYGSNCSSVKVNKLKKLKYFYLYCCDNLASVKFSGSSKLKGVSACKCNKLKSASVFSRTAKAKVTTGNQGKWWYETSAYKKLQKAISKKIW